MAQRDDLHKHLEFVQAVIARLANNSFLMKGWTLTVSLALLGYAVAHTSARVALLSVVPVLAFWYLDGYYLRQERLFRALYRHVSSSGVPAFAMDVSPYAGEVKRRAVLKSETLVVFYGMLLLVAVAVSLALLSAGDDKRPAEHQGPHPSRTHSTSP